LMLRKCKCGIQTLLPHFATGRPPFCSELYRMFSEVHQSFRKTPLRHEKNQFNCANVAFRLFGHNNLFPSPCRRSQVDHTAKNTFRETWCTMQPRASCNTDIFFYSTKGPKLFIRRSLKLQEVHHHIVLRLVQIHLQKCDSEACLGHITTTPSLPVHNRVESTLPELSVAQTRYSSPSQPTTEL
jgi:hypothetical protein